MPNIKDPLLVVSASLDEAKSKKQLQKQLDKVSKELNYKITAGDTQKQVNDTNKVTNAIKIQGKEREKVLQYEQRVRYEIEKQTNRQLNAEKLVTNQLDKQREKLSLFQAEMNRKSQKLTSGKYSSTIDTSALSSLQSRAGALSIGNASDVKSVQTEMGKINSEFKNIALNAQQARTGFVRFGDEAKHSFQKFSEYMIIGSIWMGAVSQIQNAIQATYELDNAINQVRIVTGQTEEQAQSLVGTFKELGKMANVSLTDTANLYADLTRQGLEGSALEDRFIAISKYSKISGLDVQKSMDIITSAVNGTKRPVEEIIDVMAVLGDKSSADAAEIGEALQRTASVASVAGIDFKKLSSYIATVSETTRTAASVVGASMRSMIVRFNQLREQGFNEEDTTQINDVVQALSTIGIDAFDDSTQSLMNFSDILEQLAPKWDTLDDKTRNYLQTSLAGNYQADKFAALMSNYTRAQELYGYALDSSGQATAKFEIYQESAQAKVERFQLALENLYTTLASSTIIKDAIDTGTDFVNMLNMASNDITALIPLVLSLASAMTVLKASALVKEGGLLAGLGLSAGALGGIALAVGAVAVAILSVKSAMEEAKVATENYKKAQEDLNYVLGVGGEKSKQRAEDLEELVRQYEQLTMELTVARKKLAEDESDDTSGRLTKNISNIQKQIAELGKKFKELGVTTSEAKSKIDELNQATEKSQKINESLSKLDIAEKQKKELDTVSNLASTYNELLEKKKRSKEEDEKLSSVSAVLASKLKDLGISYELNSEGIITNVSGVKTLISEKQKLTEVSVQSAVKEMTIEKERLNVMLSSIKTELEARKAYADAMAGMSFDFAKASSMENKKQNIMSDPLGLSRDTSLDKTTQFLQGQAEQYTNTSKAISDAIDSIATKTAGVPDLLSGVGDDKTSKSKKETITLLTALEKQLEANNYQLELQRKLTSQLAEGDPKRIDSLEQEIALMAQRQKLVSAQADVLRVEKASIEAKIKSNSATMEEKKRLEEINTEIYALKLSWQDLNGEMKNANQSITDFGTRAKEKLKEAKKEAEDLRDSMIDAFKNSIATEIDSIEDARDTYIKAKEKEIEALEESKDLMSDVYDLQIESAQTALDNYNATIEAQEEVNKLKEIDNKITEENLEYQKELQELMTKRQNILLNKNVRMLNSQGTAFEFVADPRALAENTEEIQKLTDDHTKTLSDLITSRDEEVKDQAVKLEQDRLQAVIDRIKKEKDATNKRFEEQIKSLNREKEAEVESYNIRIRALQNFQTAVLTNQASAYGLLLASDAEYFKQKVAGYKQMVDDINAQIARIAYVNAVNSLGAGNVFPTTGGVGNVSGNTGAPGTIGVTIPSGNSANSSSTSQNISRPVISGSTAVVGNPVSGSWLKYHDGIESGLVGGLPIPKSWEQTALLAKGEGVLTAPQMNNISNFINSAMPIMKNTAKSAGDIIINNLTIEGVNSPREFVSALSKYRVVNT